MVFEYSALLIMDSYYNFWLGINILCFVSFVWFLRVRASIAIASISCGNSVHLSVCPSRPGTNLRPGEIEISGFHCYRLVSSIS